MDNGNEPDPDLQRFWARYTEDLGEFEVFLFISLLFLVSEIDLSSRINHFHY